MTVAEPVKVPGDVDDLAHEIWAAAQTAPGEGIEDAVDRIAALLASYGRPAASAELLDMIDTLCTGLQWNIENCPEMTNSADDEALVEARALLARYDQPSRESSRRG